MLLGSIEAGGTKFVCAVGDENFNEIDKKIIPTTTPEETLGASIEFFKQYPELAALSIASFGPIDHFSHIVKVRLRVIVEQNHIGS